MANALTGATQNLPIQNSNLQNVNANSRQQIQQSQAQDEGTQSVTLPTQEDQTVNATTQTRAEGQDAGADRLASSQTPTVSAGSNGLGENVDILV